MRMAVALRIVIVASCVALLAACGATDRISDARKTGGKVAYGARLVPAIATYGTSIAKVGDATSAVGAGGLPQPASANVYTDAAAGVRDAAAKLHGIAPPRELRAEHKRLIAAVEKTARALEGMASAVRRRRAGQYERSGRQFAAAQSEFGTAMEAIATKSGIELEPPASVTVPTTPAG